ASGVEHWDLHRACYRRVADAIHVTLEAAAHPDPLVAMLEAIPVMNRDPETPGRLGFGLIAKHDELKRQLNDVELEILDVLDGPDGLYGLGLCDRWIVAALKRAGVLTVTELRRHTSDGTLTRIAGIGPKSAAAIEWALTRLDRRIATEA